MLIKRHTTYYFFFLPTTLHYLIICCIIGTFIVCLYLFNAIYIYICGCRLSLITIMSICTLCYTVHHRRLLKSLAFSNLLLYLLSISDLRFVKYYQPFHALRIYYITCEFMTVTYINLHFSVCYIIYYSYI